MSGHDEHQEPGLEGQVQQPRAAVSRAPTDSVISAFERIRHEDETGEHWLARELAILLGYAKWQHFNEVIEEAKDVCRANGGDLERVFTAVGKKTGGRDALDYRLTRHACYIIAESADGRKQQVAFAKMYFALTTERYELLASTEEDRVRLDERRILARANTELALRAREAGVITSRQFSDFFNAGHFGLYGETVAQIRARKGLRPSQEIADYMESLELSANHFRAALTRHHLDELDVQSAGAANTTHHEAGVSVREFLLAQGIRPETLPKPAKSYQQLLLEEEARQRLLEEDQTGLWAKLLSGRVDDEPDSEA
jgi:DNA-damage-inducible protein D